MLISRFGRFYSEDVEKIWEDHPKHGSSTPEKDESEICI